MLGMQQAQSHISQLGHHVPSQYQPLTTSPATSLSCVQVLPPSRMASKPKLSLNTSIDNTQPRTFGKGSSLRLDTLSAISPTVRNTYSNAYERQANSLSQNSGLRFEIDTPKDEIPSEIQSSAVSSATTSSTVSLESDICPYFHPSHLKSILHNSHYPKVPIRRMSVQRPRFPMRKSVSFKEPLQEEITTTKYTLAHSDLAQIIPDLSIESSQSTESAESSTESSIDADETPIATVMEPIIIPQQPQQTEIQLQIPSPSTSTTLPPESSLARQLLSHPSQSSSTTPSTACPRKQGHKRDSSESGSDSDDSCPQTPIASRSKRQRWAWTLGPLPGYSNGDECEKLVGSREGSVDGDEVLPSLSPGVISPL